MKRTMLLLTLLAAILVSGSGVAWAITNGLPDTSDPPKYDRVVAIKDGMGFECSGTLVSDTAQTATLQYVLTAAHCSPYNTQDKPDPSYPVCISFDAKIADVSVTKLQNGQANCNAQGSETWYSGKFTKSPYYSGSSRDDLGVITLNSQLTTQPKTPRPKLPTQVGQFSSTTPGPKLSVNGYITAAGYGDCGNKCSNSTYCAPYYCYTRNYTGPNTTQQQPMVLSQLKADTMTLIQRNGGGTCFGDSGGPNFYGKDPTTDTTYPYFIVGLTSGGDGACKNSTVSPRLDTTNAQNFLGQFPGLLK